MSETVVTAPEGPKCFVCKGPFHLATGGVHGPKDTPFCGACEHDLFKWVKHHTARRWGKGRFYDHAKVPPGTEPPSPRPSI